ncbi:MAG: tyrosine-type recombinase/integrase [Sedimentisphaerales bacterium]|nr:tyrosine-type recombinase/integrase [Sedimentisphaerales bacterium]
MSDTKAVPGSIYLNRDRYWWNVTLPGEEKRKSIPLKPAGARYATKDYQVAVEVAKELLRQHLDKNKVVYIPETIAKLASLYTDYIKDHYKSNEPENIRYALDLLVAEQGNLPVEDFGPLLLRALRDNMIKQKLSRSTINRRISMIKRMFKWGVSQEMVPAHIFQRLDALEGLKKGRSQAKEPRKVSPVSEETVEAVLPYMSETMKAMVRIHWLTGMRSTEVCIMRPCDIDRSDSVWIYRPVEHKGRHLEDYERVVPLGPQAQEILRPFLLRPAEDYCFKPAESQTQKGLGVKDCFNERYDKNSYRRAIQYAINAANRDIRKKAKEKGIEKPVLVPHWTPHQLRHAAATRIRKEYDLETAKAVLGQKRIQTTEIYAEQDLSRAVEVARRRG